MLKLEAVAGRKYNISYEWSAFESHYLVFKCLKYDFNFD